MSDPIKKALDEIGRELGGTFVEVKLSKEKLRYPFNQVSYEAVCPNDHTVQLSTGYSVFAPDTWNQYGWCELCRSHYYRKVKSEWDTEHSAEKFVEGALQIGTG